MLNQIESKSNATGLHKQYWTTTPPPLEGARHGHGEIENHIRSPLRAISARDATKDNTHKMFCFSSLTHAIQ